MMICEIELGDLVWYCNTVTGVICCGILLSATEEYSEVTYEVLWSDGLVEKYKGYTKWFTYDEAVAKKQDFDRKRRIARMLERKRKAVRSHGAPTK